MAISSRDRISVDLRGLGATLLARVQMLGISPSAFVRSAVAAALDRAEGPQASEHAVNGPTIGSNRSRLCLRMSAEHAALVMLGARQSGLNTGAYVVGLASGVPALVRNSNYQDQVAELRRSSSELATLSRNIHLLATLLRLGDLQQARPYREMLDHVADEVRAHLEVAARVLADLRPSRQAPAGAATTAIRSL